MLIFKKQEIQIHINIIIAKIRKNIFFAAAGHVLEKKK